MVRSKETLQKLSKCRTAGSGIQGRLRTAADGSSTEDYLRGIFEFPENYALEAILSLGMPGQTLPARSPEDADMSKVHWEEW